MAYVVRPLSTPASSGAPTNGCVLKTRHTSPEQSKPPGTVIVPPGAVALQSLCTFSDVPEKTYGKPTKRRARTTTCRSHVPSSDTKKVAAVSRTAAIRKVSRRRSFASEYAASARDAGSFGARSRLSLPIGWFTRSPSSRAIVSVPSMSVGSSPPSRAASRIARADGSSPAAATSWASSSRMVTIRRGSSGAVCGFPRARIASCSSPRVSESSGLNDATSGPMIRASTTEAICGAAQLFAPAATRSEVVTRPGRDRAHGQGQRGSGGEDEQVKARASHSSLISDASRARLIDHREK